MTLIKDTSTTTETGLLSPELEGASLGTLEHLHATTTDPTLKAALGTFLEMLSNVEESRGDRQERPLEERLEEMTLLGQQAVLLSQLLVASSSVPPDSVAGLLTGVKASVVQLIFPAVAFADHLDLSEEEKIELGHAVVELTMLEWFNEYDKQMDVKRAEDYRQLQLMIEGAYEGDKPSFIIQPTKDGLDETEGV